MNVALMNFIAPYHKTLLTSFFCLASNAVFCCLSQASVDELISRLTLPTVKERREAEKQLLLLGDSAMDALTVAATSSDPEVSLRAEIVIDKIELGIHPDDPPEIIQLIERFYLLSQEAQYREIQKLRSQKKYRLNTLLAERAKNPADKARLRNLARYDAVMEARMLIAAGKVEDAEKWLRMLCNKDGDYGMAFAYLVETMGNSQKEIEALSKNKDETSKKILAAFYRAAGNREQTLRLAREQKDESLVAIVELLNGNHVPLVDLSSARSAKISSYTSLIDNARNALPPDEEKLEKLRTSMKGGVEGNVFVTNALFALSYDQQAREMLEDTGGQDFLFFASQERDEEALAHIGVKITDEKPDFHSFFEDSLEDYSANEELGDLNFLYLISWLEKRGCWDIIDRDVIPQFIEFKKSDPQLFEDLAGIILAQSSFNSPFHAPLTFAKVYEISSPNDALVWDGIIAKSGIGGPARMLRGDGANPLTEPWWKWLGELEPDLKLADRYRLLLRCFLLVTDPDGQREKILAKIVAWHKQAGENDRAEKLPLLTMLQQVAPSKLLDSIVPRKSDDERDELLIKKQWQQAADQFAKLAQATPENPRFLLQQAVSLRMAGKQQEAALLEKTFRLHVLGDADTCWFAAHYYAQYNLVEEALVWCEKALYVSRPTSNSWAENTEHFAQIAMEMGKWSLASALFEASLIKNVSQSQEQAYPSSILFRTRMQANMAHGLSLAATDRKSSLRILKQCHNSLLADASLADSFFPSLRRCGMMTEHNQWFEESWAAMSKQRDRYPNYDNIYNSMAWLASRSQMRLAEAKALSQKSMKLRPDTSAYADTMAEIHFALRDRPAAIKWSEDSLFLSQIDEREDPQILRQNLKFHFAPLP